MCAESGHDDSVHVSPSQTRATTRKTNALTVPKPDGGTLSCELVSISYSLASCAREQARAEVGTTLYTANAAMAHAARAAPFTRERCRLSVGHRAANGWLAASKASALVLFTPTSLLL